MKLKKKYHGLVIPSVTPLTANYQLDHKGVENIIDNFYQHDALPFILGTTGESSSICTRIKLEFIETAAKLKQPGKLLYTGISSNCVEDSVDLGNRAFDLGADVVVAHLPAYFNLTESEIKHYFEMLADSLNGPLIIYNIPATTHVSIPLQLIDELSHHENIVGTKDSERSVERLDESLDLWANRADFSHILGWAAQSAYALMHGSDGLVPSTGNLCPEIYQDMIAAVERGDSETALLMQEQSNILGDLYQSKRLLGGSLAALKSLMQNYGLCQPHVMPPLQNVTAADAAQLQQTLLDIIAKQNITLPSYS